MNWKRITTSHNGIHSRDTLDGEDVKDGDRVIVRWPNDREEQHIIRLDHGFIRDETGEIKEEYIRAYVHKWHPEIEMMVRAYLSVSDPVTSVTSAQEIMVKRK